MTASARQPAAGGILAALQFACILFAPALLLALTVAGRSIYNLWSMLQRDMRSYADIDAVWLQVGGVATAIGHAAFVTLGWIGCCILIRRERG